MTQKDASAAGAEIFSDIFADNNPVETDETSKVSRQAPPSWKVVIVDDEEDVHEVTRLALSGFEFDGRKLDFISAYSGKMARQILAQHPDAAAVLLDVVMETDHEGLDVVRFIREDLQNKAIRIVLRTGQPGQAPEEKVITEYDINDYKEKTELTHKKLFTLMCALLRAHRDIMAIEMNKRGLEQVLEASASIFELKSMEQFAEGVLDQMSSLLYADQSAVLCRQDGLAATRDHDRYKVLAGTGKYAESANDNGEVAEGDLAIERFVEASRRGENIYENDEFVGYFCTVSGRENLMFMSGIRELGELDRSLMEVFARNVGIAFENVELHQDIEETQREIVYMLGEAVETRSQETGNHVKRVAEISRTLALALGLPEDVAEILRLASPLHDVGKIGIPDAILNKPGKLDESEWEVMKTHAQLGAQMLAGSNRRILQAASLIAGQHHERWDGAGYPDGRNGEDIHIYGRITAVADVFDALGSRRCYKEPWPIDNVLGYMDEQSGRQFDPALIDALKIKADEIVGIRDAYEDKF